VSKIHFRIAVGCMAIFGVATGVLYVSGRTSDIWAPISMFLVSSLWAFQDWRRGRTGIKDKVGDDPAQ
jgi:hypothetical protein